MSEVTWTFAASRGHVPENCRTFQKFVLEDLTRTVCEGKRLGGGGHRRDAERVQDAGGHAVGKE